MKEEENKAKNNDKIKDKKIKREEVKKEEKEETKKKFKEEEKKEEEHFKEPELPVLFVWFIGMLSGKSWEYLGLIMNPETKKANKDLKKAKITIDTIAFLYDQIKDDLNKEDYNRIESLLANLRMNYVEKLKES
ncbi:MAG: DUF1844 domain-containing protein [Candidatus Atribacteria bacterium]|jgi:hypothetical protein|nr:DUF1844 domain-containing protein [Candidatus Atribacteria bacterium]